VPKQVAIAPATLPPPAPDRSTDLELTFWNSIKDSKNAADYQAYIDQFPKGTFVGLAKIRTRDLQKQQMASLPQPVPSQPPSQPTQQPPSIQLKPPDPKPDVVKAEPPKSIPVPASTVYSDRATLNGKSFFGSSAGGNRWLIQFTVKGERLSVDSMWLEMGAERFQMNCGGLFSPGLAIAADLTVSGNCTGGNTTRTVTGRFPDLTVGDISTSNYDTRWPATTASGAMIRMIDEGSRLSYLAASQTNRVSTKDWSESTSR
jgi:hypothetical protein